MGDLSSASTVSGDDAFSKINTLDTNHQLKSVYTENVNANELKKDGIYFPLINNAPGSWGMLFVSQLNWGQSVVQMFLNQYGQLYTRTYISNTWSDWVEK